MERYAAVDLISAKRDGRELTPEEIAWLIDAYTRGVIADEQMSALAMAVFFRDLSFDELDAWTQAMIASGVRLNFSDLGRPSVDKHSTGGVGDKITLPLVPLVAACGAAVPQLSGRGLGHTGGTLDKMESIAGWRADLSPAAMHEQLASIGAFICAATPDLAPADKRLYALRDVTATVESIPLISASIMSKKIAEGTDSLVLDVKVGRGAFMKDPDKAADLAQRMVELGARAGVRTVALLTNMDTPLGLCAGNALEVQESVEVLAGGGPSDIVDLTCTLAREMLGLAGIEADPESALADGRAMDKWRELVRAQGGDPDAPLPRAHHVEHLTAAADGVVADIDPMAVGLAAWRLGAGRARKEDAVQAGAGVALRVKPGDVVRHGQVWAELHTDTPAALERASELLTAGLQIAECAPPRQPLVWGRFD